MTTPTKRARGRPSAFDREMLLAQVMGLFWQRGYHDMSFNEVAQETGLTRASLYNAFKTKEALFTEALEQYFSIAPDKKLRNIAADQAVGPVLLTVFMDAAKMYSQDPDKRGCMAVNCMNELMSGDTELSDYLSSVYEQYKQLFLVLIQQAIRLGELPPETQAGVTANMLLAYLNGFSVFSKSNTTEQELVAMGKIFLSQIGFKSLTK